MVGNIGKILPLQYKGANTGGWEKNVTVEDNIFNEMMLHFCKFKIQNNSGLCYWEMFANLNLREKNENKQVILFT